MFFKDIIGQQEAKQRLLREAAEGRIAHALLFCGPPGAGKLPLALAYARYLCCTQRGTDDACGTCPSCIKFNKLVHPDVHFMFPVVKNAKKRLETCNDYLPEWRALLLANPYFGLPHWLRQINADNSQAIIYAKESDEIAKKLNLKSSEGGYKAVVLWLPERLHEVCANKLLKLLEEPPRQTVFLLVSEDPQRILPTILSRTQRFDIPPVDDADIARALQERYGIQPSESQRIAHIANGNFVQALEAIHLSEDNRLFHELFVRLMRLAYQRKIKEMKAWSEETAGMGRERQKNFLEYCQRMVRENFVYNFHAGSINYMTTDEEAFATRFAPFVNTRNVEGMMHELAEAQAHVEQNVNARMVFFDFALKMIVLLKQ